MQWYNPLSDRLEDIVVVAGGFNGRLLSSVELLYVDNIEYGFLFGPGKLNHFSFEVRQVEFAGSWSMNHSPLPLY
jgi:hypothetical protein